MSRILPLAIALFATTAKPTKGTKLLTLEAHATEALLTWHTRHAAGHSSHTLHTSSSKALPCQ